VVKGINYVFAHFTSWDVTLIFNPLVWIWILILVIVITLVGSYRAASSFLK